MWVFIVCLSFLSVCLFIHLTDFARSIPTPHRHSGGKLVDRFVGMPSEQMLSAFLERLLALSPPGGAAQPDAPSTDAAVRVRACVCGGGGQ